MASSERSATGLRLWSFDGGGPGVISQLLIVNEIMYRIQWALNLSTVPRPCEYAELMVGTGLGGIAVILMARLCLTAEQTLTHIAELGLSVFEESVEPKMSDKCPRYDVGKLKAALISILEHHGHSATTKMIEDDSIEGKIRASVLTTPVAILSSCRPLRTYSIGRPDINPAILEALLATTANPTWFPPMTLGRSFSQEKLIGGATGFNNPTSEGLEEAKRIYGSESTVSIILSLGSGQNSPSVTDNPGIEGLVEGIERMTVDCDKTASELARRFASSSSYFRFSVDKCIEPCRVSDWSEQRLGTINSHTKNYLEEKSASLDCAVQLLIKKQSSHTLGQLTGAVTKPISAKSVPRLTPYYVPRPDVHTQMERYFLEEEPDTQKLFVLHGMAGSGKTQSTAYFERRNGKSYDHILFVDGSTVENIQADLQSAIRSLGGRHSQETFEGALRFLSHPDSGSWLIIFDNVDDPNIPIHDYFPPCHHGTIIITTRNSLLATLAPFSNIHLGGMSNTEATAVLFRASHCQLPPTETDHKSALVVCEMLGGLPLALVHVGWYCHFSGISFADYLKLYEKRRKDLMKLKPNLQLDKYARSAYAALDMSYSLLKPEERSFLHLLASFHPISIPIDIFRVAASRCFHVGPIAQLLPKEEPYERTAETLRKIVMPRDTWDDLFVNNLTLRLQSFSLASLSSSGEIKTIIIHPLIRSWAQDILSPGELTLYSEAAVVLLASCSWIEDSFICRHLLPHIFEVLHSGAELHANHDAAFGEILLHSGQFQTGEKRWESAKSKCSKQKGQTHSSTLRASYHLAWCMIGQYRTEAAEVEIRKTIELQEGILGEDKEHILDSYYALAYALRKQHKLDEANVILNMVLETREVVLGKEHYNTLLTRNLLAMNFIDQCKYAEAQSIYKDMLPIVEESLGKEHGLTFLAKHELARALKSQGRWIEAERILKEVIKTWTLVLGKEHPNILRASYHLSICLYSRGELIDAKNLQQEVLEMSKRALGDDHPETIDICKALVDTLRALEGTRSKQGPIDEPPRRKQKPNTI